ncbi:hypothetical protein QZH41_020091, partial [Actinostola sp. cb2023]
MSVSSASNSDAGSQQSSCICTADEERKDFDSFPLLFIHLKRSVDNNLDYFIKYTHKSVYRRFHEAFERIHETLEPTEHMAVYIAQRVTIFDFSPEAKGNGYRSLLGLLQHCIRALSELTYYCQNHRDRFYFRSHHYCLEIEAYADLFTRIKDLLNYAITCMNESKEGKLFPDGLDSRIMVEAELMDRECFYGRTLGFQIIDGSGHHYSSKVKPQSKGLIFHIHGGGFVSQSSKSHEMYLRVWARELNVPIISVDYSLAPEAPFPRALEECFFAYAWAVKNADKLGTTAQYLCVVGDSAGGNLSVAVCMRAAEYGIRRPDSLLTAYSPFNVQYVPSPSRLLSLLDPLLPSGILSACLGAYAGLGKSPFEECMKTPANSALMRKQTSSSLPMDINKARRSSFLDKFKRGSRSPRSSNSSPTQDFVEHPNSSFGSFHSCPGSPLNSDTALKNNFHVKSVSSSGSYGNRHQRDGSEIGIESWDTSHRQQRQEAGTGDDGVGSPREQFHSFKDDHEVHIHQNNPTRLTNDHLGKDHGHHHAKLHMESNRLLKLNLEDHNEVYVSQQIYDPLGDEYGHAEMQYTRSDDQCHVVNVVDPDHSPCGETMVLPVEDPCLRIGTPPLKEMEQLEVNLSPGVTKGKSMSQVSLPIAKNPYMSPLVAPAEMLATLPPIDIVVSKRNGVFCGLYDGLPVACSLDPLLDDSIEFGRRLRSLGKEVE